MGNARNGSHLTIKIRRSRQVASHLPGALQLQPEDLTVYENVYFSARLRLAPNTGLFETASRVEKVLKDVGISHVKDTVVGTLARSRLQASRAYVG